MDCARNRAFAQMLPVDNPAYIAIRSSAAPREGSRAFVAKLRQLRSDRSVIPSLRGAQVVTVPEPEEGANS